MNRQNMGSLMKWNNPLESYNGGFISSCSCENLWDVHHQVDSNMVCVFMVIAIHGLDS